MTHICVTISSRSELEFLGLFLLSGKKNRSKILMQLFWKGYLGLFGLLVIRWIMHRFYWCTLMCTGGIQKLQNWIQSKFIDWLDSSRYSLNYNYFNNYIFFICKEFLAFTLQIYYSNFNFILPSIILPTSQFIWNVPRTLLGNPTNTQVTKHLKCTS